MLPPQELEYSLRIPDREPRLDFGTGILAEGEAVTFSVKVVEDDRETTVLEHTLESADRWNDARLDLARWAGQEVRLRLSTDGSPENVAFWSNLVVSGRPVQPFNVVILLEDALRADHLSTNGYDRPTAPFKDRFMGEEGVVFLRATSQATKTRPSVPSLMTSLLPTTTGVWDFADVLPEGFLTLAEVMRQQGFVTASFVQNGNAGLFAGLHQGFDALFDAETTGASTEDILGDRLVSWIERNRDRNFFLYIHVMDPHGVYEPPAPFDRWYREMSAGATPQDFDAHLDPEWEEGPTVEGRRHLYDGEIRHNDAVIEEFLGTIEQLGLKESMFLVLTSDHGEHLGERELWEHDPPGFLQVTGVPLMFVYPKRFRGGQRIDENVQLIDVMPTVLELARVDASGLLMQGDSLVDLVEGREISKWRNRVTLSEEPVLMDKAKPSRNRGLRVFGSMFYRDWHFIASRRFWPQRGYWPESLRMKVFNIANDREEARELWSAYLDLYLRFKFTQALNGVQGNSMGAGKKWSDGGNAPEYKFDPDDLERLKALGYVE
jgi:arylsulfatase A-like enzyme